MRLFAVGCFAVGLLTLPERARACGASSPGAPAGVCDATEALDAKAAASRAYRVGLTGSYTTTAIWLSDGARLDMQRETTVATLSLRIGRTTAIELGAGALVGGSLGAVALRPGPLGSVSASWRALEQRGPGTPFALITGAAALLAASTADGALLGAVDFRMGAAIGTTLGTPGRAVATPYLAGQLFGGPTFWAHDGAAVTGTDVYKYALGGGLAVAVGRVGFFAGGALLGERSVAIGASIGL